ncbi:cytochrome P450 [Isoptericola sp. b490]|uniref:cytochrome P450 n=1 Tax=Actinotalea lenta TaxID=3064654 RepID=UPI0027124DF1|nr:cytochrome P450 [Isoptericola sp. b490]MDO8121580.1 cytochrome P450 [Isoptericola sp. b490]
MADEWDPRAPEVLADQVSAYDAMRARCPVAHDDYLGWTVFTHQEAVRVVTDHTTFSNVVSSHLSVPNGMDPPEHTPHRRINESYFTPERMAELEPTCRRIAADLVASLPAGPVDVMAALARPYALAMQTAFMGWPERLHEPLRAWTARNHAATLARDPEALESVALEFDGYIREQLDERRAAGDDAPDDVTTRLLRERVHGLPLTDEEIVSVVRNWTVGELGTIAASVGILVHVLAQHRALQDSLRSDPGPLPAAIDEALRIHPPLIANRRRTTCPVELGGREIPAGERVTVLWASANRDEAVMGDPDEVRLDRDPADYLLYGAGIHECPGAPLARMELRVLAEELLARTTAIRPAEPPTPAAYPAGGFTSVVVDVA